MLYTFGDESGSRFGAYWTEEDTVGFRFGKWNENVDMNSSNYQELQNLVETLKDLGSNKEIDGREVFLCTNNMVSESIAAAGSSREETLYDLVCMRYRCKVRYIDVNVMRMIGQGTNGISRGIFYKGVMNVKTMLFFLPLGGSVLKISDPLVSWIDLWASEI